MDNKGYYKTLGVAENATDDEIKKAYRTGAIKWHPDRWVKATDEEKKTAEDNFKKLNEAYSVLSDKDKRKAYDMGMDSGAQQGPGFDPWEFFKQASGNMGFDFNQFFGGGFGGFQQQQAAPTPKGQDVNVSVDITMAEANSGVSKEITIETPDDCEFCHGTGVGEGGSIETCPHCHGSGIYREIRQMGFARVETSGTCNFCGRTGKIVKNPCPHCGGTGLNADKMKERKIKVSIPVGVAPGETVTVLAMGEKAVRGEGKPGNVNITVNIDMPDHYRFMNNMGGVEYEMEIPFYDAILGCTKEVMFPSGDTKKVKIDKNTKPGTVYSFKGEGMKFKDGKARSSFDVVVNYEVPKKLTKKQEEILKEFKNVTENGS